MSTKNSSRFTPVIIAISVVIGILIGTFYAKHFAGNRLGIINGSSNKLNALLRIVDDQYVDTVNMADLVEKAMPQILAELDPPLYLHSGTKPGRSDIGTGRQLQRYRYPVYHPGRHYPCEQCHSGRTFRKGRINGR